MTNYLVAAVKQCEAEALEEFVKGATGNWHLITRKDELTLSLIERLSPRYVFFPTWYWKVPENILAAVECVCFHMTDLPYGRGGSPLQNLILAGHSRTKISALRMTEEMDAGPVYVKRTLSLEGRAQEVYERAAKVIFSMVEEIVAREPVPVAQQGDVTTFRRRRPEQSVLPGEGSFSELYDFVRMLDADGYPRAFLDHGEWRLEFSHAEVHGDRVEARVTFRRREEMP